MYYDVCISVVYKTQQSYKIDRIKCSKDLTVKIILLFDNERLETFSIRPITSHVVYAEHSQSFYKNFKIEQFGALNKNNTLYIYYTIFKEPLNRIIQERSALVRHFLMVYLRTDLKTFSAQTG